MEKLKQLSTLPALETTRTLKLPLHEAHRKLVDYLSDKTDEQNISRTVYYSIIDFVEKSNIPQETKEYMLKNFSLETPRSLVRSANYYSNVPFEIERKFLVKVLQNLPYESLNK